MPQPHAPVFLLVGCADLGLDATAHLLQEDAGEEIAAEISNWYGEVT